MRDTSLLPMLTVVLREIKRDLLLFFHTVWSLSITCWQTSLALRYYAPSRSASRSLTTHSSRRRFAARLNSGVRSEEHTSELQSLMRISYAVFCLKKKIYTVTTTCDLSS